MNAACTGPLRAAENVEAVQTVVKFRARALAVGGFSILVAGCPQHLLGAVPLVSDGERGAGADMLDGAGEGLWASSKSSCEPLVNSTVSMESPFGLLVFYS